MPICVAYAALLKTLSIKTTLRTTTDLRDKERLQVVLWSTSGQHSFIGAQIFVPALHGQNDEITAGRDHSREDRLPDHARARWNHHLDVVAVRGDRKILTATSAAIAGAQATSSSVGVRPMRTSSVTGTIQARARKQKRR